MIYYTDPTQPPSKISRDYFKEIFGITYKKKDNDGIRFEDAHCGVDPYYLDVEGLTKHLVASSYEKFSQVYDIACDDI